MKKQIFLNHVALLLVFSLVIAGLASQARAAEVFKWDVQRGAANPGSVLFTVVDDFAKRIKISSGGRLDITVRPGGSICPNTKELEAVHNGIMQLGISSCGWQLYLIPTASIFCAPVGGMDGRGMRMWYEKGDGMKLWNKATEKFNIVTLPGVPVQSFPPEIWVFSKFPIKSLKDLKGRKMRAMGDGGAILNRLGLSVTSVSPSELYEAMMRGVIDMTEATGPWAAIESNFQEIAKYWYLSGSRANSDIGFAWVNKDAWAKLPEDLQGILKAELAKLGQDDFDTQFSKDLRTLAELNKFGVKIDKLPEDIDKALLAEADKFYAEKCAKDPFFNEVYTNLKAFQKQYDQYIHLSSFSR